MQALFSLPLTPADSEALAIVCRCEQPGLLSLAFAVTRGATISSSGTTAAATLAIGSAAPRSLQLTLVAQLLPAPLPQPLPSSVQCTLSSSGGSRADPPRYRAVQVLQLPTLHLPAQLPLFTDILVEVAPLQFRSAWGSALARLPLPTRALPAAPGSASTSPPPPTPSASASSIGSGSSSRRLLAINASSALNASGWLDRSIVYAFPDAASAALAAVSQPPTPGAWLSLTLSGATHLILVGPASHPYSATPAFDADATTVSLGGKPATVNWVLNQPGGPSLLSVVTPPLSAVCSAAALDSGSCGLQPLVLNVSSSTALDASLLAELAQTPDRDALGGIETLLAALPPLVATSTLTQAITCPPACGVSAAVLAAAMAALPLSASAPALLTNPLSNAGGGGITYITVCTGGYTDPASGACINASNPLSYGCALGTGDRCRSCPAGSLCPGGNAQWPRPGHALSGSGSVVPCAPPALQRCAGYDPGNGQVLCGPGYKQGTQGCSGCAASFYQDTSSGRCLACPTTDIASSLLLPLLYMAGGFAALFGALAGVAAFVVRRHGGTLASAMKQCIGLLVWMWGALQLLVSAARTASTAAPLWLQGLFSALLALQFEGVTLNPSCFDYIPFVTQWMIFGLSFVCLLLVVLFSLSEVRLRCSRTTAVMPPSALHELLRWLSAFGLRVLCLLFAVMLNATMQVAVCLPTSGTVAGYLALKQSGAQFVSAPSLAKWQGVLGAAPAATQLLQAYLFNGAPLSSLPPALQEAAPAILASNLDYAVLASNSFVVCYEGAHYLIFPVALGLLMCLLGFPLVSFLAVRHTLHERMSDGAIVGSEVAERWRVVGGHWLPIPGLAQLLRCLQPAPAPRPAALAALPRTVTVEALQEMDRVAAAEAEAAVAALKLARETRETLTTEAAELLDATPRAHASPTAILLHPWTVGDRRPSRFFFSQMEHLVLLTLTIASAFSAGTTKDPLSGTSALPSQQALALEVQLLLLTLLLMGVQVYATLRMGQFFSVDFWKRDALVTVLALTVLSALLRLVNWVGGTGVATVVLSAALFGGTVLLFVYLLRSFFLSLVASCKAEAAEAMAAKGSEKKPTSGGETQAFFVRNPMLPSTQARFPLGRRRGLAGGSAGAALQQTGAK